MVVIYDGSQVFITSCICHACDWARLALGGKTANAHFSDWFHGRAEARAVDARGPNARMRITRGVSFSAGAR